ncbi:NF-kappa-B inhibitor delta isoform X2 [Agelaius phoeniceus]|uniref:NF-kappa-B inhibitor delta isoform X2 n=1 Tax=Agelaius phoeniceus TaxID=39638 RepID=UPI004054B046
MRPQRGPPRAAPPQTVKQLLKELRQQKSREGARSPVGDPLSQVTPPPGTPPLSSLTPSLSLQVLALPSPRPSDGAPWPVVPAVTPSLCAVPHVSHGSPGGAHGGRVSGPRGFQAAAVPGPAWPHPTVPWGEFGASLLGREIQDPYPEPQDLAAARAALGGQDPRELLRQDEEGDTLLHVLCAGGHWALARAAAEALRDLGGLETPLLVAAAAAAPEIVRDLLVLGANPDAADHGGRTALHLAAAYGHPQILQAMMSSGVPVNVEARNFEGQTPLHCAVLAHNASLQGGHSPTGGSGGGSPTPQDRFRCVELLLQMGADSSSQDTKSSLTALHMAVRGGNLALAHLLLRQPGMAPRLINIKAHGNTPLHMAAALPGTPSQEPLVRLLLAWGADPSARNLEHDLPQSLLPPGAPGDQVRPPDHPHSQHHPQHHPQITPTASTIPRSPPQPAPSPAPPITPDLTPDHPHSQHHPQHPPAPQITPTASTIPSTPDLTPDHPHSQHHPQHPSSPQI